MLDFSYILNNTTGDIQIFQSLSNVAASDRFNSIWTKPRGATMVYIFSLCAGSGGGSGFFSAAGGTSCGGGGGGCGGHVIQTMIPAIFVPKTLAIRVGQGGKGGDAGSGSSPTLNCISEVANNYSGTTSNYINSSGGSSLGGSNATSSTGGAAGTFSNVVAQGQSIQSALGLYVFYAGVTGTAGGTGAVAGTALTLPVTGICSTGGTGGGGKTSTERVGGAFNATANTLVSERRPIVQSALSGANGTPGYVNWKPFYSYGGCGGSSSDTGTGGTGGHGGLGSGGGGGGAGFSGSGGKGGVGGDGGDGLIVIISW